ncbi:hypothetical protein PspLS_06409 [Pyricularia sp. CBS 133598]|nr:hypothetical protein PspLS_06409 [Pyricularia sp. CBS 133598]
MGLLKSLTLAQSLTGFSLATSMPRAESEGKAFVPSTNLRLPYNLEDAASAVVNVVTRKPSVVLEDVPSLKDVKCADGNVVMVFDSADGIKAVKDVWPSSGDFVVVMSESAGTCSGDRERGFFLLGELTHDDEKLTVTAVAEKRRPRDEIKDAIVDFSRKKKVGVRQRSGIMAKNTRSTASKNQSEPLPIASETFEVDLSDTTLADTDGLYLHADRALFTSTVEFEGHLHYNLEAMELEEFNIQTQVEYDLDLNVTANIDSRLGLDLIRWSPLSASISAFNIPGIISIGPRATFSIGVELAAEGPVNVTTGYHSTLEGATVVLDLLDEEGTKAEGWEPETSGGAEVSTQVALQINPFADLSVDFGIDVFEGALDLSAGIAARPTLVNAFVIGSDFEFDGETGVELSGPDCPDAEETGGCCSNGAWYESRFWFEVRAFVTQFYRVPLYTVDLPIYEGQCWEFGGESGNSTEPVGEAPKCKKKKRSSVA